MLRLFEPKAVTRIADPDIRRLVAKRFVEISAGEAYDVDLHGYMIVVEPCDTVAALEEECGSPILHNLFDDTRFGEPGYAPSFEHLEDHGHGQCYEMIFIMSDDGSGVSIFIPKGKGIDAELLKLCNAYAAPAQLLSAQ